MAGPGKGPDPVETPIFSVKGLTNVYRTGEVEAFALRGVDLELNAGEMAPGGACSFCAMGARDRRPSRSAR